MTEEVNEHAIEANKIEECAEVKQIPETSVQSNKLVDETFSGLRKGFLSTIEGATKLVTPVLVDSLPDNDESLI